MIIKNAQAGLMLQTVIISNFSVKNQLAQVIAFDENDQMLDIDYNLINVEDSNENVYVAELELITKIIIKQSKKKVFDFKITHTGLLSAPKNAYKGTEEFVKAVKLNGLASLISFARANIATITGAMFCQGSIMLPMINVFNLHKLKDNSENKAN